MTEEIYEFRDGVLMKFNPETNIWEEAEKKEKEWKIIVNAITGTKDLGHLTGTQRRKLMNCLQELAVHSSFFTRPITEKMAYFQVEIKPTEEHETSYMTKKQAEKLTNCAEPVKDLVFLKMQKLEDVT
jgi:hypothetical protein